MSFKRIKKILRPLMSGLCAVAWAGDLQELLQKLLQTAPAQEPTLLPHSTDTSRGFMLKFPIRTPLGIKSTTKMMDFLTSSHFFPVFYPKQ